MGVGRIFFKGGINWIFPEVDIKMFPGEDQK